MWLRGTVNICITGPWTSLAGWFQFTKLLFKLPAFKTMSHTHTPALKYPHKDQRNIKTVDKRESTACLLNKWLHTFRSWWVPQFDSHWTKRISLQKPLFREIFLPISSVYLPFSLRNFNVAGEQAACNIYASWHLIDKRGSRRGKWKKHPASQPSGC